MKLDVKVPRMGESISEATVSAILKPAGSLVKTDDELLELATDKVNQVLYAQQGGIFTPSVAIDEVVKIDQVIGHIDTEGKSSAEAAKEPEAKPDGAKQALPKPPETSLPEGQERGKVRHTAKEFLEELRDTRASEAPPAAPKAPKVEASAKVPLRELLPSIQPLKEGRQESRRKMSRIRKVIASRLVEVQQTAAMLTTFNEVDMTAIMLLRERYKDIFVKQHGVRLGFMSFFVKAVVSALRLFPDVNSYIDGDEIVHRDYYDIGIAVGTERGLVVPVVRNCDELSFTRIEKAISDYAAKVKEGMLSADDLQGGGFTITNGGIYGSLLSTPIISPQQCAILGMHKISKRPVVINDQIVIRDMMYLALSYDHRIIDGKEAVSFLVHIKNQLEDPSRMLLNI